VCVGVGVGVGGAGGAGGGWPICVGLGVGVGVSSGVLGAAEGEERGELYAVCWVRVLCCAMGDDKIRIK
jgi:hypothetical protein